MSFVSKIAGRAVTGLMTVVVLISVSYEARAEVLSIGFVHTHTGESIAVDFKKDGVYLPGAVERLKRFLRDHRNGEIHDIDPTLFDILYEIRKRVGAQEPFHLISCYRSPRTNEMLRRTTNGVASKSMHMDGRAIDVRLPGVDTGLLRDIALQLKAGGVGYYEKSDFLHVDTGRVRRW